MSYKSENRHAKLDVINDVLNRVNLDGDRNGNPEKGTLAYKAQLQKRRDKLMRKHHDKMCQKQQDIIDEHSRTGKVPIWFEKQSKASRGRSEIQSLQNYKNDRNACQKRMKDLDKRVQRHLGMPQGAHVLVHGLKKQSAEELEKSGEDKRITNKISIEEKLNLNTKDTESRYMDTVLSFVKLRGSDYGLSVQKFLKKQFRQEDQELIKEELKLGVMSMKCLSEKPNQQCLRYWRDKMKHIKTRIKANKFDIQIPESLEFPDSEEEMLIEVHETQAARRERLALIHKMPPAVSKPFKIKKKVEQKVEEAPIPKITQEKKQISQRPKTPIPFSRMRRATALAAYKHQWRQSEKTINQSQDQISMAASVQEDTLDLGGAILTQGSFKTPSQQNYNRISGSESQFQVAGFPIKIENRKKSTASSNGFQATKVKVNEILVDQGKFKEIDVSYAIQNGDDINGSINVEELENINQSWLNQDIEDLNNHAQNAPNQGLNSAEKHMIGLSTVNDSDIQFTKLDLKDSKDLKITNLQAANLVEQKRNNQSLNSKQKINKQHGTFNSVVTSSSQMAATASDFRDKKSTLYLKNTNIEELNKQLQPISKFDKKLEPEELEHIYSNMTKENKSVTNSKPSVFNLEQRSVDDLDGMKSQLHPSSTQLGSPLLRHSESGNHSTPSNHQIQRQNLQKEPKEKVKQEQNLLPVSPCKHKSSRSSQKSGRKKNIAAKADLLQSRLNQNSNQELQSGTGVIMQSKKTKYSVSKKQKVLLSHPNQIKIETLQQKRQPQQRQSQDKTSPKQNQPSETLDVQQVKEEAETSIELGLQENDIEVEQIIENRNTSSVDLSAGLHYFNQNRVSTRAKRSSVANLQMLADNKTSARLKLQQNNQDLRQQAFTNLQKAPQDRYSQGLIDESLIANNLCNFLNLANQNFLESENNSIVGKKIELETSPSVQQKEGKKGQKFKIEDLEIEQYLPYLEQQQYEQGERDITVDNHGNYFAKKGYQDLNLIQSNNRVHRQQSQQAVSCDTIRGTTENQKEPGSASNHSIYSNSTQNRIKKQKNSLNVKSNHSDAIGSKHKHRPSQFKMMKSLSQNKDYLSRLSSEELVNQKEKKTSKSQSSSQTNTKNKTQDDKSITVYQRSPVLNKRAAVAANLDDYEDRKHDATLTSEKRIPTHQGSSSSISPVHKSSRLNNSSSVSQKQKNKEKSKQKSDFQQPYTTLTAGFEDNQQNSKQFYLQNNLEDNQSSPGSELIQGRTLSLHQLKSSEDKNQLIQLREENQSFRDLLDKGTFINHYDLGQINDGKMNQHDEVSDIIIGSKMIQKQGKLNFEQPSSVYDEMPNTASPVVNLVMKGQQTTAHFQDLDDNDTLMKPQMLFTKYRHSQKADKGTHQSQLHSQPNDMKLKVTVISTNTKPSQTLLSASPASNLKTSKLSAYKERIGVHIYRKGSSKAQKNKNVLLRYQQCKVKTKNESGQQQNCLLKRKIKKGIDHQKRMSVQSEYLQSQFNDTIPMQDEVADQAYNSEHSLKSDIKARQLEENLESEKMFQKFKENQQKQQQRIKYKQQQQQIAEASLSTLQNDKNSLKEELNRQKRLIMQNRVDQKQNYLSLQGMQIRRTSQPAVQQSSKIMLIPTAQQKGIQFEESPQQHNADQRPHMNKSLNQLRRTVKVKDNKYVSKTPSGPNSSKISVQLKHKVLRDQKATALELSKDFTELENQQLKNKVKIEVDNLGMYDTLGSLIYKEKSLLQQQSEHLTLQDDSSITLMHNDKATVESLQQMPSQIVNTASMKVNVLSMDSSLQVESIKKEVRYKKSMTSQEIRGITKSGGFRRPVSSTFYQVKGRSNTLHPSNKPKPSKINADLLTDQSQSQKQSKNMFSRRNSQPTEQKLRQQQK